MADSIHSKAQIHPTAIVADGVSIGAGSAIGPFCVIGPGVVIGERNEIRSHVVIEGNTVIGNGNTVFQFASVGAVPQDLKYRGEPSRLEIGDENIIREYVTLQPGTRDGGMLTKVGNANLFMACSHVAHDVIMGDRNILANSCALAGHVEIGDGVIAGGLSGVHQFVRLGNLSYLGAGAMVSQDVPPFCTVQGDRAGLVGINVVGLKRAGKSSEVIQAVKNLFQKIFKDSSGAVLKERLESIEQTLKHAEESELLNFVKDSKRGVCSAR